MRNYFAGLINIASGSCMIGFATGQGMLAAGVFFCLHAFLLPYLDEK